MNHIGWCPNHKLVSIHFYSLGVIACGVTITNKTCTCWVTNSPKPYISGPKGHVCTYYAPTLVDTHPTWQYLLVCVICQQQLQQSLYLWLLMLASSSCWNAWLLASSIKDPTVTWVPPRSLHHCDDNWGFISYPNTAQSCWSSRLAWPE